MVNYKFYLGLLDFTDHCFTIWWSIQKVISSRDLYIAVYQSFFFKPKNWIFWICKHLLFVFVYNWIALGNLIDFKYGFNGLLVKKAISYICISFYVNELVYKLKKKILYFVFFPKFYLVNAYNKYMQQISLWLECVSKKERINAAVPSIECDSINLNFRPKFVISNSIGLLRLVQSKLLHQNDDLGDGLMFFGLIFLWAVSCLIILNHLDWFNLMNNEYTS